MPLVVNVRGSFDNQTWVQSSNLSNKLTESREVNRVRRVHRYRDNIKSHFTTIHAAQHSHIMAPNTEDIFDESPPSIDPYQTLGVEKSASESDIRKAYHKAALKNHPDKVDESQKSEAHIKFQAIAFAYAILSDPTRRKRYDTTGSTSESISGSDDFNWSDFYREQFTEAITAEAIEKLSKEYKGSDEERDDVLAAYTAARGNMDHLYEVVMLSNVEEDDDRFRKIIDDAIESGDVKSYKRYVNETQGSKDKRKSKAHGEADEAIQHAKDLGIHDQIFGGGKGKGKKKGNPEDALKAMIMKNRQERGGFLDKLEEKYTNIDKSKRKNSKKRGADEEEEDIDEGEPSEEAFQAVAARLKKKAKVAEPENGGGRRSKRKKT